MTDIASPLVPAEVDLRDFPFTPIFRSRLFGSSFHARVSDAEWRAGVTLWLKSWDQVPAGSLPDDDVDLCRLAELGRDMKLWLKLRPGALHGWFACTDGRLYHKVVAEGVNEAWQRKQEQRDRTEKARAAKLAKRLAQSAGASVTTSVTDDATGSATDTVTGSKGQGQGQYKERSTASPVEYAFVGKVVRLKPSDFDAWSRSFRNLDLMAELTARDAWLASEEATDEDRRKWFISTSRLLLNRNAEAAAKGLTPKGAQKPRPQADDWAKDIDLG